jgi:hypothetical protein
MNLDLLIYMVAKKANDGVSLLDHDVVANESTKISSGEESLNLSGALDILWQIKDRDKSQHSIIQIDTEPFMIDFFEKVPRFADFIDQIFHGLNIVSIAGPKNKARNVINPQ